MASFANNPDSTTTYLSGTDFSTLKDLTRGRHTVYITDDNVLNLYSGLFPKEDTIVLPSGEAYKNMDSILSAVDRLAAMNADRQSQLVGVGGGVITDITGFLSAMFMRGVDFGFVPTTLLGMVDAAIGGKNGVNHGVYKNMIGTIRQPGFVFFNPSVLQTLPEKEWSNGFAEIIKYACIFDAPLFSQLSDHSIQYYQTRPDALHALIQRCVGWKRKIVSEDEREHGHRKLLNFGHTLGHAIEKTYELSHGAAISIGMSFACTLSEKYAGLQPEMSLAIRTLLQQYKLSVNYPFDVAPVIDTLKRDKKKSGDSIQFILLTKIGESVVTPLSVETIRKTLELNTHAGGH